MQNTGPFSTLLSALSLMCSQPDHEREESGQWAVSDTHLTILGEKFDLGEEWREGEQTERMKDGGEEELEGRKNEGPKYRLGDVWLFISSIMGFKWTDKRGLKQAIRDGVFKPIGKEHQSILCFIRAYLEIL